MIITQSIKKSKVIGAVCLTIALLIFAGSVMSQEFRRFEQLSFAQGLGADWYFHIAEDSLGFIWFAGHTGLSRFDGKKAVHYMREPENPKSLAENQVFRLFIRGEDEIWCSTLGGGMSILNPSNGTFTNLTTKAGTWPVNFTGKVLKINESEYYFLSGGGENSLWRLQMKGEEMEFTEYPIEWESKNLFFRDNKARYLLQDPRHPHLLYIVGNFRIYRFDTEVQKLDLVRELEFLLDDAINFDLIPAAEWIDDDHLILSLLNRGLWQFSIRDGSVEQIFFDEGDMPHHSRFIRRGRDGTFWVGYSHGKLYRFDLESRHRTPVPIQYPNFGRPVIEYIFEAKNGDLYIASNGGGIMRSKKSYNLINILLPDGDIGPDFGNWFYHSHVSEDGKKILYNKFFRDTIFAFDTQSKSTKPISGSAIPGIFRGNFISGENGKIYTHNRQQLFSIDPESLYLKPLKLKGMDTLTQSGRFIRFIESDHNGLWLVGGDYIRHNSDSHPLYHFNLGSVGDFPIPPNYTFCLLNESEILIQAATRFFLIDMRSNTLTALKDNLEEKSFSEFFFTNPAILKDQLFIPCRQTGLWKASIKRDSIFFHKHYSAPDQLLSNNVSSVTTTSDHLWISTGLGFQRYNPDNGKFINFDYKHSLPSTLIDRPVNIKANGSFFTIPLSYNILYGNMAEIIPQSVTASAVVTSIKVDNEERVDGFWKSPIHPLYLNYDEKILEISWGILNASAPYTYQLSYQLKGFDKSWVEVNHDEEFSAVFTNLAPGWYHFNLAVTPLIDQEPFTVLSLPIYVKAPFWKTWWFISFLTIVLLFAIYYLYRFRVNALLREEKLRAEFQEKLTRLEISQLRSQMNPHFMFNSLNSIKLFILKNERELAAEYLSDFAELIRDILNYSKEEFICLDDEIKTLKTYLSLEQLRLTNPIDVEFKIDPSVDMRGLLVQPLILQPFVENALWHGLSHKEGERKLRLSFRLEDNFLICEIEDNGIGRESAQIIKTRSGARRSHGINITKERIYSQNSDNSISIIDLFDDKGDPAGTKVIIKVRILTS